MAVSSQDNESCKYNFLSNYILQFISKQKWQIFCKRNIGLFHFLNYFSLKTCQITESLKCVGIYKDIYTHLKNILGGKCQKA